MIRLIVLFALTAQAAIPPQPAEGDNFHPAGYDYSCYAEPLDVPAEFCGALEFINGELYAFTSWERGAYRLNPDTELFALAREEVPLGVRGAHWDGETLWLTDHSASLYRYDGEFNSLQDWGKPYGERWYIELPSWQQSGILRLGEKFLLVDELGVIYLWRLGEEREHGEWIVGRGEELVFDGVYIWMLSYRGVLKLTTEGIIIGRIPLPAEEGFASGLAWDGKFLWLSMNHDNAPQVWKLDLERAKLLTLNELPEDRRDAVEY
ncbi:hypothetical protein K8R78_02690 [bacterium]|nr:hypothetical protein [bacterium]